MFAYFVSDYIIFVPPRPSYSDSSDLLKLITPDGKTIFAFYLHNKKAKYTILVSHGNAEDIGFVMHVAKGMYNHGFSVFIYDYHGYGLSNGKPSEKNVYFDIDAAYDFLTKKLHIDEKNIIAYGHSLGAAVALDLAVRKPMAALILQGAFVSAFRVKTYVPLFPFDKFNNLRCETWRAESDVE